MLKANKIKPSCKNDLHHILRTNNIIIKGLSQSFIKYISTQLDEKKKQSHLVYEMPKDFLDDFFTCIKPIFIALKKDKIIDTYTMSRKDKFQAHQKLYKINSRSHFEELNQSVIIDIVITYHKQLN